MVVRSKCTAWYTQEDAQREELRSFERLGVPVSITTFKTNAAAKERMRMALVAYKNGWNPPWISLQTFRLAFENLRIHLVYMPDTETEDIRIHLCSRAKTVDSHLDLQVLIKRHWRMLLEVIK